MRGKGGVICGTGIVEAGFDRAWVQYALAEALKRRSFRGLIPAVLYRLERCDPPDVEFIVAFRDAGVAAGAPGHTDVWDNPESDLDSLVRDAPDQ